MRKTKTMTASDAKEQFDKVLDQISRENARVVVEKDGSPMAAIVTPRDLERLQRLEAEADEALARMRAAFSDLSEEQIVEDVGRVIEEVRTERRGSNQAQAD